VSAKVRRMTIVRRHFVMHGRVQGVGFRWSMAQAAGQLGVGGWVRNRRDGTVEAMAAGDARAVDALADWARQGPPSARVDRVEVCDAPDDADVAVGEFVQRETV